MDKEIRYFVNGYEMLLYLSGDREERKSVDYFELQDFESEEEAVAAARDFISEHKTPSTTKSTASALSPIG